MTIIRWLWRLYLRYEDWLLGEVRQRQKAKEVNRIPDADGYYARRLMPDGREAVVMPLTYGRARIGIGPLGEGWLDDAW